MTNEPDDVLATRWPILIPSERPIAEDRMGGPLRHLGNAFGPRR